MNLKRQQAGLTALGWLLAVLATASLVFAGYARVMLAWSYSSGERAGWVQKLSRKGFLCKTWEGEMVMVSMPGTVPEKFAFTAWDDEAADAINQAMGKRVSVYYEEHLGLPTSCFGDTRYFVKKVKVLEEMPAAIIVPGAVGTVHQDPVAQPQPGQPTP